MSFFDSKEEVIKIELTQYGKYLLSKGKFNPKYYSFFDDDIIYDIKYANIEEKQNDVQERILNSTPYNKPQGNFSSVEIRLNELIESKLREDAKKHSQDNQSNNNLPYSIGTSDLNSPYVPAWNISVLSGSISSSSPNYSASTTDPNSAYLYTNIPQLNMKESTYVLSLFNEKIGIDDSEQVLFTTDNGETILYSFENILNLFDVVEKNTTDTKENFLIEVFIEEDNKWKQLYFKKRPSNIQNNILLDSDLFSEFFDPSVIDPSTVEHYFDILTDMDIVPNVNKSATIYTSPVNKDDEPFGDKC